MQCPFFFLEAPVIEEILKKEFSLIVEVIFHLKYSQNAIQRFFTFFLLHLFLSINLNFKIKLKKN